MDINYTGRLAVSLYGILIQGWRHNGNSGVVALSLDLCSPAKEGTKYLFFLRLCLYFTAHLLIAFVSSPSDQYDFSILASIISILQVICVLDFNKITNICDSS